MFNCLNDYVILHKTLGSFANGANGATAPLLAKKWNGNYSNTLEKIITSNKTWCARCLEDNNDLFNLTRLFARGQTSSIMNNVRNNGGIHSGLFYRIGYNKYLLILKKDLYDITLFNMDRSFVNSPNTSLVAKIGPIIIPAR